jgi:hypothetical protein
VSGFCLVRRPRWRYYPTFMGQTRASRNDEPRRASTGDHPLWWLGLLGLLAGQAWLTLSLFGPEQPVERLLDDQPILSGRHPLHLYHGYLGARALCEHGVLSCYDPTFHAGYPKTPVFDSGSRPAELLQALTGGRYRPDAYKVGLAVLCASVPLLLFAAARSVGLSRAAACLACGLGSLVWWGQPCREALEAGEVDLLLAALLLLAQAGLLLHYHREPGVFAWLGVLTVSLLGWFAHPLLMVLVLPLFLVYYLSVGTRHRLSWHIALLGAVLAALCLNGFWLVDWISYWWIRVPLHLEKPLLAHRTFRTVWEAPLWGGPVDKVLACTLLLCAALGVLLYNQTSQRATARLLGLGWLGFLVLTVVGLTWEPLGRFGAHRLLVPALLFATLPAAYAIAVAVYYAGQWRSTRWGSVFFAAGSLCALGWSSPTPSAWVSHWCGAGLQLGLGQEQKGLLELLEAHTTSQARILWEDQHSSRLAAHWTALLSLWTERSYLGGLDAEAGIEHTANGLVDQVLAGRPIREWTDSELDDYCERYNVGWVVCWSPKACERFGQWPKAELTATVPPSNPGGQPGCLFTLRRAHSFALVGSAHWVSADAQRIILSDVVPRRASPEDPEGEVVLSLHYQDGMRVTPSRVRLQPKELAQDSIPFVRLRVAEPVTRVTITWEKR